MSSIYKQQLNGWVESLDVKATTVIDIGGSQNPIRGRTNSWDVQEYHILDLNDPHVLKTRPDIVQDMNEQLVWDHHRYFETADLIFCLGVFDYIINPSVAFENIYTLLCSGGKAWVEFPFVYAHHNPLEVEGLRYTEQSIYRLCKQANLSVVDMLRKPAQSSKLVEFYREDGQRMAPDYGYHNTTGFIVQVEK